MLVDRPARGGTDPVPQPGLPPLDALVTELYPELLEIARRERRRAAGAATLDTRAVLHEAFLRLARSAGPRWQDRAHFLACASGTMRHVLIDHLRRRRAAKRDGGRPPVTLSEQVGVVDARDESLLALDDALTELARVAPRLARVVECRYFGGMTEVETAEALGVTERTVRRDWIKARGWLRTVLAEPA